jgi:acetyl-CoA carboxylase carboxyl transferase subunit beta
MPGGLWMKCDGCRSTVYRSEVEANSMVCPECGHHYRIGVAQRIGQLLDPGTFVETHTNLRSCDPLQFSVGGESYTERIERAKEESGLEDALTTGFGAIENSRIALGVMDASFIMASMGSVVGEKFCRLAGDAIRERTPLVVVAASGGARMQEGILGLMQMAKTAAAVRQVNEAGIAYISILTDPATGGVLASFAGLGDVIIAEPGAYIGFAGQRLIAGAFHNLEVPEGFQSAEYQSENGFIDRIVPRPALRPLLARLVRALNPAGQMPPLTDD